MDPLETHLRSFCVCADAMSNRTLLPETFRHGCQAWQVASINGDLQVMAVGCPDEFARASNRLAPSYLTRFG